MFWFGKQNAAYSYVVNASHAILFCVVVARLAEREERPIFFRRAWSPAARSRSANRLIESGRDAVVVSLWWNTARHDALRVIGVDLWSNEINWATRRHPVLSSSRALPRKPRKGHTSRRRRRCYHCRLSGRQISDGVRFRYEQDFAVGQAH